LIEKGVGREIGFVSDVVWTWTGAVDKQSTETHLTSHVSMGVLKTVA